ncbi:hypothetical protein H9L39_10883 [Fusarium oxysporum f. sp. albedinis]|nr:hypothetical protein H9L39_10883 [Fusarium oxysporum f. sp. albedinis]
MDLVSSRRSNSITFSIAALKVVDRLDQMITQCELRLSYSHEEVLLYQIPATHWSNQPSQVPTSTQTPSSSPISHPISSI